MLQSKKLFVSLLVVLALFTMSANATVSRLEGLGGSGDSYWWDLPGNIFVLHDAATPGIWPQLVQQYPNLAGGEFGTGAEGWDLQKVYVNYSWNEKKGALQFILDKPVSDRFGVLPDPNGDGGVPGRLMVNYGQKIGEDLLLGIGLSYWGDSESDNDHDVKASIIGLKLGLSGVGDNEWDAVLGLEMPGFTNEAADGTTLTENDGSLGIHFAGRYWWNYSEKTALIPNIRFQMLKDAAKAGTASLSGTGTQIGVGIGHNWWPVENALVLSDFGVLIESEKYEFTDMPGFDNYDDKTNVLPYWRIGFETTVFAWLDGRIGAERGWISNTLSGDAYPLEPKFSTSQTSTFLGATAHWNRMVFDLVISPRFIHDGPYFVSGNGGDMFTRVSLKYDFNQ